MNHPEKPPELDRNLTAGRPELEQAAISLLESENVTLRRMIVELLHKNQQLREQLHALTGLNATVPTSIAPKTLFDPQAA
jgi:hypothetical protein